MQRFHLFTDLSIYFKNLLNNYHIKFNLLTTFTLSIGTARTLDPYVVNRFTQIVRLESFEFDGHGPFGLTKRPAMLTNGRPRCLHVRL